MFKPPAYYKTQLWVSFKDSTFKFDVDEVDFQESTGYPWKEPKLAAIKTTILVNSWEWKAMMEWWADTNDAIYTGGAFKKDAILVLQPDDHVQNWKVSGLWPMAYDADHDHGLVTVTLTFDTINKMDPNGKPTPEQLTEKTLAKYGVVLVA